VVKFLGQVNFFHGRLEGGKVHFATLALDSPEHAGAPTQAARVFIRPHELDVGVVRNGQPALEAVVTRIHSAGPNVRLELQATSGERLHAELTQERYRSLGISTGSTVYVTPREVKVFADKT
jgi:sulfate transport system ATP-binding protein